VLVCSNLLCRFDLFVLALQFLILELKVNWENVRFECTKLLPGATSSLREYRLLQAALSSLHPIDVKD
jgi:hypothetical protein